MHVQSVQSHNTNNLIGLQETLVDRTLSLDGSIPKHSLPLKNICFQDELQRYCTKLYMIDVSELLILLLPDIDPGTDQRLFDSIQ